MTLYCTEAELISAYTELEIAQLTDNHNVGAVDSAKVSAAIVSASALIDSFVSAKYTLPLSEVPNVLRDICLTVTRYKLHVEMATEQVIRDYEDAIKWLMAVRDGKNSLGLDQSGVEFVDGQIKVIAKDPIFDDELLAKMVV